MEETEEAQCCCQACVRLTDRPAGPRRASLVCVCGFLIMCIHVFVHVCVCVLIQSGRYTHTSLPKVDRLPEQYKSAPALVAGMWKLACRDSFQYLTHCYIYCPKYNTFYCIQNVKPARSRILHA